MKIQRRTLTVRVGRIIARTNWRDAALVVESYSSDRDDLVKVAVIKIEHPLDLAEIRRRCDDIEAHWRQQLEGAKP